MATPPDNPAKPAVTVSLITNLRWSVMRSSSTFARPVDGDHYNMIAPFAVHPGRDKLLKDFSIEIVLKAEAG
jgi:hypothetical protein